MMNYFHDENVCNAQLKGRGKRKRIGQDARGTHPILSLKGRDSTTDLSRVAALNLVAPDVRRGFCPATSSPRWLRLLARGSRVGKSTHAQRFPLPFAGEDKGEGKRREVIGL